MNNSLFEMAASYGIILDNKMIEDFNKYSILLEDWNKKFNLTAIKQQDEVECKHFLDSLLLVKAINIPLNANIIDVGAGAGFPTVPIKILRPDVNLTLLDGLAKRVVFLTELSNVLEQSNLLVHGRAEEYGRKVEYRDNFSIATARAVAALPALCEYCLPFVKIGGVFAALKGWEIETEIEESLPAIKSLGAEFTEVKKFKLPDGSSRSIVVVKKISQTPLKYPRAAVKITKNPILK